MQVCFATPIFDGSFPANYHQSMMRTLPYLFKNKIIIGEINETKNFISQARNRCAHYAINNGYDKLIFIDADMSWDGPEVMELINSPHKVVGGSYPFKTFPIKLNFQPLMSEMAEYEQDPSKYLETHMDENGEVEVHRVPTGFLCIDVSVFKDIEPMCKKYNPGRDPLLGEMKDETMFFPMGINEFGGLDTEDWGFCDLVQKAGHKIYFQTKAIVDHVGRHVYSATKPIDKAYKRIDVHEKTTDIGEKNKDKNHFSANPFKSWPRNLFCFCGSGRKFKNCCDLTLGTIVKASEVETLKPEFERMLKVVQEMSETGVRYQLETPVI